MSEQTFRAPSYTRVLAIVLVVLAVLSTAGLVVVSIRERGRIECQAAVNQTLAHAIQQRGDASKAATRDELAVVNVIINPASNQQTRLAALKTWADSLAKVASTQDANPLPDASNCH